ncbi:hypothetical protein HYV10_03170 [Candidatus Dependentiae bacterium]|nr:hypothetical protein [Candidatus Dependentiae bacterium]
MKKILSIIVLLVIMHGTSNYGNYLWEYIDNGQHSCCLHLGTYDICNPGVPCVRNNAIDLLGIYDYVGRILHMEKISTFPYAKFLNEAQSYIRKMATLGNRLSYHVHEYRSSLKFFHDLAVEHSQSKNDKPKGLALASEADKQKKQDEVFEYLVKIGLATKFKK